MEVVIPAKRDKGGRRFGFARFDRVADPYKLENDLDNIIFGGEKISSLCELANSTIPYSKKNVHVLFTS
jgi:hypothetical protein